MAANWVPIEQAPPGPGDKAIIPNGKSCLVDSDEAAEVVEIAGGATLTIAGKTLTTQDDGVAGQVGGIKVDGTLRFERAAGVRGVLRYAGTGDPSNFAITGGGTLIAEGSTHAGRIENLSIGGTETLTIGDGTNSLTVKGTITIRIEKLDVKQHALLLVDNAGDEMRIDDNGAPRDIEGGGTIRVSAGELVFEREAIPNLLFTGAIEVLGGTMTLLGSGGDFGAVPLPNNASVKLTPGGILRIERGWESYGGLEFTGGKIQVTHPNIAAFMDAP